jgi:hypothetical protein
MGLQPVGKGLVFKPTKTSLSSESLREQGDVLQDMATGWQAWLHEPSSLSFKPFRNQN